MTMRKNSVFILLAIIVTVLAACGGQQSSSKGNQDKIVIASQGSDAQVWQFIAKSDEAKKAGLNIEVKEFNDGVQINEATNDGQVDVNAFQSLSYFQDYVKKKKAKLVAIATTYLEPMGLYSDKYQKLEDIPNGAKVAIPNDTANTARGLRVLEKAGLIKLKSDFNSFSTLKDIDDNPKKLQFVETDGTATARVLPDVDAALIGNSVALDAGLNAIKDSLYHEEVNQDTKANINLLVTQEKNKDNKTLKKLAEVYHSKEVQNYVKKEFGGTKIPVDKPVNEITN